MREVDLLDLVADLEQDGALRKFDELQVGLQGGHVRGRQRGQQKIGRMRGCRHVGSCRTKGGARKRLSAADAIDDKAVRTGRYDSGHSRHKNVVLRHVHDPRRATLCAMHLTECGRV